MTFTLFVSVSLLALVVTARPFADPESGDGQSTTHLIANASQANGLTSRNLREAVQAVFRSKTGYPLPGIPPSISDTDIRVHLTSPAVLTSHLAALELEGLDAVKAVLPLPFSSLAGVGADGAQLTELTDEERQLYDLLRNAPGASLEDLDGGVRPVPELAPASPEASEADHSLMVDAAGDDHQQRAPGSNGAQLLSPPSPALVVLAVSALISLIVVACVSVSLYTVSYFRKHVLRSNIAWDILPRIENGPEASAQESSPTDSSGSGDSGEKDLDLIDFDGPVVNDTLPNVQQNQALPPEYSEKTGLVVLEKDGVEPNETSDVEDAELDEKFEFYDAPLLFVADSIPQLNVVVTSDAEHADPDPDFLPLPASPRVEPLAIPYSLKCLPSQTQMRERDAGPSPVSKPAWSVRAAASPALGLPASAAHAPSTPLPFTALPPRTPSPPTMPGALFSEAEADVQMAEVAHPGRSRAYRAPMPELDIAFALQLRPGLGLGAEGAWLVRFLMAMFGWLGVVVGGGGAAGGTVPRERRAVMA